ncbi:MAG: hypothetical protein ACP5IJ_01510 [Candidatus Nanoarchaeia archaeon]
MRLSEIIKYYSQKEILEELIRYASNREVVAKFGETFGKRPDILQFPNDVIRQVRAGATSWHASEELWSDPLKLRPELDKKELDKLRIGFDLVLDIDCKVLEWSKACAELLCKALEEHEVKDYSIKFSGGTGFHIGIPWEALYSEEMLPFPDTAQIIAQYLKTHIKKALAEKIIEKESDIKTIVTKSGKKPEEIKEGNSINPYKLLEIDTVAISPRHLLRMPYSLNEKKWLVSLPIRVKDISEFDPECAKPEYVQKVELRFLERNVVKGSASGLLNQANDWFYQNQFYQNQNDKTTSQESQSNRDFTTKVPEQAFPPCIQTILAGLEDGRKRSLFALLNFLKICKWNKSEIEQFVRAWNLKNNPPLKEGYIRTQLNWHLRQTKLIPPPNCKSFYQDFGVCKPDKTCEQIKNPISYPRKQKIIKI